LFLRNAVMGKAKNGRIPLRDFSNYSLLLYKSLPHSLQAGIRHDGILMLSATEKTAHEEQELAKFANSFGLEATLLSKSETEQLQGGISLNIAGSVLYKCDSHLDPRMLMQQLIAHLEGSGVKFLRKTEIKSIDYKGSQVESIRTANGVKLTADAYVMAAGAYSADLAGSLSSNIPVVAGKGYSFLTEKVQLRVPCLLAEARVAITPLGSTTRVGGTMELGRMRPCVNLRRIGGIVKSVNKYIPGVNLQLPDKSEVWYGFRPCSPDGLPYLGISRKAKNLVFATGHGMLGVSLGPATGKLVARLLNGGPLAINIDAFSPDRFS
ncbi:MAG TPA: FAD-binding oxidoreductase, partial [Parasegetibacter sp.]